MPKLFFGLVCFDEDGFMDFQDNFMRTICVVAETRAAATAKIKDLFLVEVGIEPDRICLQEITEVDGYRIVLEPHRGEGGE